MIDQDNAAPNDDDLIVDVDELETNQLAHERAAEVREMASRQEEPQNVEDDEPLISADDDDAEEGDYETDDADDEAEEVEQEAAAEPDDGDVDLETHSQLSAERMRHQAEKADLIWNQAQLYAQMAEQRINTVRVGLQTIDSKVEQFKAELVRAEEAGDIEARIEINNGLSQLANLRAQAEQELSQCDDPQQILQMGQAYAQQVRNELPPGEVVGAGIQAHNPLAARWANANSWMKTNAKANQFVLAQSERLMADGWDPTTPGYYTELGRRVRSAFPNLRISNLGAGQKRKPKATKGRVRSAVAPARSTGGVTSKRSSSGDRMDRSTIAAMVQMRLDPNNKEHLAYFKKSRAERLRQQEIEGR